MVAKGHWCTIILSSCSVLTVPVVGKCVVIMPGAIKIAATVSAPITMKETRRRDAFLG